MVIKASSTEHDLSTALRWRYATKKFDEKRKIDAELWSKIEEALILTPSSFGLQPWKFVVITDPVIKAKLPEFSWNQMQVVQCSHLLVICRLANMSEDYVNAYADYVAEVRGMPRESVDMLRNMMLGFLRGASEERLADWMSRQCYIALGNLMTVASDLGVDNCPMEGFSAADYDRILGLTEKGLRSVVACALGYRAADDKYASLKKVRFASEKLLLHI